MPADPVSALRTVRAAHGEVPEQVRRLGWVSFWTDASSELLYPLLPLFLSTVLHAPVAAIGLIEGIGEAVATALRAPAGIWSDRHGRRPFVVAGYGLSSIAKPLLALAPGWGAVLVLRVADRVGKGVRTAPRDALITAVTTPERRGFAFGYHRSMDTLGAVVGPLVAVALLTAGLSLRQTLAFAAIPAILSLALLFGVREPPRSGPAAAQPAPSTSVLADRRLRLVLAGWVVFSLGNSSDAFLLLRSNQLGLSAVVVVLAYAAYNLVYAVGAWPAGALGDRVGRRGLLCAGLGIFAAVYAGFAAADAAWQVWPLFVGYGAYMALTDGVMRALVGDLAPTGRAGAALGLLTAAGGAAALVASVAAGLVWDAAGPEWVFAAGAVAAVLGALVLAAAPLGRAPVPA